MTRRHHLNAPESILRTSISYNSHNLNEIVAISEWLPANYFGAVFLIGKIIKNHYDPYREFFIWWIWSRNIMDHQRGIRKADRKNPNFLEMLSDVDPEESASHHYRPTMSPITPSPVLLSGRTELALQVDTKTWGMPSGIGRVCEAFSSRST